MAVTAQVCQEGERRLRRETFVTSNATVVPSAVGSEDDGEALSVEDLKRFSSRIDRWVVSTLFRDRGLSDALAAYAIHKFFIWEICTDLRKRSAYDIWKKISFHPGWCEERKAYAEIYGKFDQGQEHGSLCMSYLLSVTAQLLLENWSPMLSIHENRVVVLLNSSMMPHLQIDPRWRISLFFKAAFVLTRQAYPYRKRHIIWTFMADTFLMANSFLGAQPPAWESCCLRLWYRRLHLV